ncbi:MAG: DNA polymerase IV [Xanthomonadales bacterium]
MRPARGPGIGYASRYNGAESRSGQARRMTAESSGKRAILHVDMDAFYASVEELDDPGLSGLPVVVGGLGSRGVVATANYAARRFGVHSAMPMAQARRRCPQARFIRPRMERYREVSRQVFRVFEEFTPRVEGLSLDEAFLDVTGSLRLFGSARTIADAIRHRIREVTGLTASVGVAHNKFLAKLASDAHKPNGLTVVEEDRVQAFLDPMPVTRLWGIGKRTAPRLRALGLLTIGQLRRADPSVVEQALGSRAAHFMRLARGEDDRAVSRRRPARSISHEVTFEVSLTDTDELLAELQSQTDRVATRLRAAGLLARTVTVKIRDDRFHTVTRSRSMVAPSSSTRTLYALARALFSNWRANHRSTAVRLLGMGVSALEPEAATDDPGDRGAEHRVDRVFDAINRRFGSAKIAHARTLLRRKE